MNEQYLIKENLKVQYMNKLYSLYPVLKSINENYDSTIDKNVIFKDLKYNEYLNSRNQSCSGIPFVIRGQIKIQKINENGDATNLYNIKAGDICHEALSCIVNLNSLNIFARALEDSVVCIISEDVVQKILLKNEAFLLYMYSDLYENFNKVISNKETRLHDNLETRIIKFFLSKKSQIIYTTHQQLAYEIDSSREAVIRKLKLFESKGYIKLSRGKITLIKDVGDLIN